MAFVNLMDIVYPVGSVYMTTTNVSPASTIGGTWTAVVDKFLKGADSASDNAMSTGGSNNYKLSSDQLPAHAHNIVTLWNGTWHNAALISSNAASGSQWPILTWTSANHKNINGRLSCGLADDPSADEDYPNNAFNNQPSYLAVYIWYRTA